MSVLNEGCHSVVTAEGRIAAADVAAPDAPIGINCVDCVHVVALPTVNLCMAPQLADLFDPLSPNTDAEPCQCARSFRHACGIAARWFVKREGFRYSYVCDCWKNNGQGCIAHDPQLRLQVQSIGASQA